MVVHGKVHHRSVIPHYNIALTPAVPHREIGFSPLCVEVFQQRLAFFAGHVGKTPGEGGVDVKRLAATVGVRTYDRMARALELPCLVGVAGYRRRKPVSTVYSFQSLQYGL